MKLPKLKLTDKLEKIFKKELLSHFNTKGEMILIFPKQSKFVPSELLYDVLEEISLQVSNFTLK